jgi:SapC
MQIAPPFGYSEVVPFLKTQKLRLPAAGELPQFVQRGNAIPISLSEFRPAGHEYPIVFTSGDAGKTYAAVAVLGISAGENLYCSDGAWARDKYLPAYVRRYPFCMAKVTVNKVEQKDRLICVEKSYIDENGAAMFDTQGNPQGRWKDIERLLTEYEADLERGREMCAILAEYGLLEPFSMQATLDKGGAAMQITGMHRVAEKNLENLNAAQIKNLMRKGLLARIYVHLMSLDNFKHLLERKAGRASSPAAA